jgi:cell division septation protein DedD
MGLHFCGLNKKYFVAAFLCAIIVFSFSANYVKVQGATATKTVYVVICVDAQSIDGHFIGDPYLDPTMDMTDLSNASSSAVSQVMGSAFRNSITDPSGGHFKITWFPEMDYLTSNSAFTVSGNPVGVSGYTAVLSLLQQYWGNQIQSYGDEIEYNHMFEIYQNGAWVDWNSGPTAYPEEDYGGYQNTALDHMIIDNNFYPTAFRAGEYIMSTPMSNWLEQYIPFYFTQTGSYVPTHFYSPGLNHWQTTANAYASNTDMQSAFVAANSYGSSIYSFYMNDYDAMQGNITYLQSSLNYLTIEYPSVTFKYVTATQAMQADLGYTDTTPPTFTVTRNGGTYAITSSKTLWNNSPYVALEYSNGVYENINAALVGTNTWTISPPNSGSLVKIGVAASDLFGNPGLVVFAPLTPPVGPTPVAPAPPLGGSPEVQVPVHTVTASAFENAAYNPGNAINGNESTSNYWGTATTGGLPQWLTLDLWNLTSINQVITYFYDADGRTYGYYIEASTDGSNWTTIVPLSYVSGVATDTFSPVMARFVRITVTADSAVFAAHIEQIQVYEQTATPTPTPTPTPSATPTPTPSATPTPTPSATPTPTPTPTSTATPTPTPTPTTTPTPTPAATSTPTPTATVQPTSTPASTSTPTPVPTTTPTTQQTASSSTLLYSIVAIVVVAAVGISVFMLWKQRRNLPPAPPQPQAPPPTPSSPSPSA